MTDQISASLSLSQLRDLIDLYKEVFGDSWKNAFESTVTVSVHLVRD